MSYSEDVAQSLRTSHKQLRQASRYGIVECPCGVAGKTHYLYRCLYCGVFHCRACAEKHFGKTRSEWVAEQKAKEGGAVVTPNPGSESEKSGESLRPTLSCSA
jgi:hypothetical protein